ncbi:TVP38/TMEM64 family protein [Clostridium sp. 19966]|uniref:TVP38/TMEM64 family membrane protein n=1 Tax=Clostridium butyricum TaxID=1492 RepID=A0A6N2ZZ64_CLOBU|nr:TVP38/TMEM64 family protein [Clostridium sp. 19966]MDT8717011.1 TVP38/TMEM64 family protein [Clostridium sp. 19966]
MKTEKIDHKIKIKLVVMIIIISGIVILGINFAPWIIEKVKKPEALREYLRSFGGLGFLMYILLQAVHVLLVVIPGDIFNVCGGFIYGIPLGFLLSMVGLMLGTVCAFYISRLFGYEFISRFIPKDKIDKIEKILNSTKGMLGMLIICLIPVIPKDLMMYIAGLTPIKASKLFFVYGLSRIPGTLIWVSVGAQVYDKNILGIIITLIGLILLISTGLLLQNRYKRKQNNV